MTIDLVPAAQPVEWLERVELPDEALVRALSALANPVRLRILKMLLETDGCFCGDLVPVFGLAQSTVSHLLKTLREAGAWSPPASRALSSPIAPTETASRR
jgi:DNA-binding transcriptional ArsR family regulator